MNRRNVIGQAVAKLRCERGWTQETLAARLQCHGYDVSREVLANLESGRTQFTDVHIMGCQKAFGVTIIMLFPKSVRELDEKFSRRIYAPKPKPRQH